MPTATEIQTETVTFIAKCPNQVLTRRAARHIDNGIGGKEVLNEAEWFERMREKGESFDETPWKVEFVNHIFSTDNPELIAWLRGRPTFNANVPSGFYEQGAAPDEPQPTTAHQMKRIAETTAEADVDSLNAVLDLERNTHNRPEIVQAAEAALRTFAGQGSEPEADAGTGNGPDGSDGSDDVA